MSTLNIMNRRDRRAHSKKTGTRMLRGIQELIRDPKSDELIVKRMTVKEVERKSRAGVIYINYIQS